jgi:AcrR family transcriptional regulator
METSDKILEVAIELLEREGPAALTTRAVCERAGVTAPTLYHHFGTKDGLQRALVQRVVAAFLAQKRALRPTDDALADLKRGWNGWIGFALACPNQFRLMIETARTDPSVASSGYELLRAIIDRLAAEGRLRTNAETAARTVWAASNGVLTLFLQGESAANVRASSDLMLESLVGRLIR